MTHDDTPSDKKPGSPLIIALAVVIILALVGAFFGLGYNADTASETAELEAPIAAETEEETETALGDNYPPMPDPSAGEQTQTDSVSIEADEPVKVESAASTLPSEAKSVERILGLRAVGDPNAPVKIEEFASLTCPHCASFHQNTYDALKEKYIDTGKVYFIYRDFPLDRLALDAVITARCLPEDKYESFVSLLFKTQRQWAAEGYLKALRQNAKLAGLSDEMFDYCIESKEIREGLTQNMQGRAKSYDIKSTPTFVLNDGQETIRGGNSLNTFAQVIEKILSNTGE